ncbi:MAG: tetratricopeptide repeat protein, partial [Phycisphaerales bacterium]
MARPAPGKGALTPAQHQRLREQLKAIMGQIGSGQIPQAAAALKPLQRKYPAQAEVAHVASGLHARLGEHERAIYHARRAIELAPGQGDYHAALGTLLVQNDRHDEAMGPLDKALALKPGLRLAMVALGIARMQTGEIDRAREIFSEVLRDHPGDVEAANNLALLESDTAHAHRAVEVISAALERVGEDPMLLDGLCMFASYDDQLSSEEVFAIHKRFGDSVQRRVRTPGRYANSPDPDRRVRVGFVSPDLRTHSVAYFLEPIFEHLDRGRFELCVYSTTAHPDAMTERLRGHADQWRDCTGGIADTHQRIAADRVDILIELTGHFAGNLLPL